MASRLRCTVAACLQEQVEALDEKAAAGRGSCLAKDAPVFIPLVELLQCAAELRKV